MSQNSELTQFVNKLHDSEYVKQQIDALKTIIESQTRVPPPSQGIVGLENVGNSCFFNAILQCMRHTHQLTDQLMTSHQLQILSHNLNHGTMESKKPMVLLVILYLRLVDVMWNQNTSKVSPVCLRILLGKIISQFNNLAQHDAHEVLINLLQLFHECLSYPVRYEITGTVASEIDTQIHKAHTDWVSYYQGKSSVILKIFGGQMRTEIRCLNCHRSTFRFDPMMVLDLPLETASLEATDPTTLTRSLDLFTTTEQLSQDNSYLCQECQVKTMAHKQTMLWMLPSVLIIKINRFQSHGFSAFQKNQHKIIYPVSGLDMTPYVVSPRAISNGRIYDLFAVTCHIGHLTNGHYYAICYNPITQTWMSYNDDRCTVATNPVDENTYILFYQRRET
uniref:USP domain-containing protein n=1 Tax=viral metagenome TaxID=1070528 RepID=A0A6C0BKP6_9ZZZZ